MENTYSNTFDLVLNLTINSGFIGLSDFGCLMKVDKYLKLICKKYINDILVKCDNTNIKYNYHTLNDDVYDNKKYNINYWYNLFGKKLNKDEMVLYYGYFINNYKKYINDHSLYGYYSKKWICILSQEGFIKEFHNQNNLEENLTNNDILMKITLHQGTYSYTYLKKIKRIKYYWNAEIIFENNKNKEIKPSFVNLILLKKLLTDYNYNYIISLK
jgi:hypothetical protein